MTISVKTLLLLAVSMAFGAVSPMTVATTFWRNLCAAQNLSYKFGQGRGKIVCAANQAYSKQDSAV
jgi:hypothetical protein